jgi:hypothetical protein
MTAVSTTHKRRLALFLDGTSTRMRRWGGFRIHTPNLRRVYRLLTFGQRYHRPVGVPPASEGPGVSNINETIDSSVFARRQTDKTYRPPALASWAKTKNVDLDRIKGSVRADDPAVAVEK